MRKKLLISFLVVIIIGISITGLYSLKLARDFYMSNLESRLESNGRMLSDIFMKEYAPSSDNYDSFAKYFSNISNSRVTIIAPDGRVIGESDRSSIGMENHLERAEVKEAFSGSVGRSLRFSSTEGLNMLYVAIPAGRINAPTAVIRLAVPLNEVMSMEYQYFRYIIAAVAAGIIGAFIIAFFFIRNIIKPVKEMTEITSEIADGSYDKRITLRTTDEIGELAKSFNNMAEKLDITINDLSSKNNELEAILKSMQSGVIAVDNIGKIFLVNPAAISIFGIKEGIIGRHILEVLRNIELEDIILKHQDETKEIKISYPEKRILRVKATPIIDTSMNNRNMGVVVVMQDVTELRKLEQVRSDFVANVSHELKTPLTSIKGFAETLKSGAISDDATREKFLDIINVEADRLTRLINDILSLSELENKKPNFTFEEMNLNDAVEDVRDMMESLAKLKDILMVFDLDEKIPSISGNYDKVKQLLINLIDNAIKYTPRGGTVTVRTYTNEKNVCIEFEDTGIGIPKEHLPRLFERFYRVDKGRSRALGGTGLGLAIVKHIVAAMGGNITVESIVGKGSRFVVTIPEAK